MGEQLLWKRHLNSASNGVSLPFRSPIYFNLRDSLIIAGSVWFLWSIFSRQLIGCTNLSLLFHHMRPAIPPVIPTACWASCASTYAACYRMLPLATFYLPPARNPKEKYKLLKNVIWNFFARGSPTKWVPHLLKILWWSNLLTKANFCLRSPCLLLNVDSSMLWIAFDGGPPCTTKTWHLEKKVGMEMYFVRSIFWDYIASNKQPVGYLIWS